VYLGEKKKNSSGKGGGGGGGVGTGARKKGRAHSSKREGDPSGGERLQLAGMPGNRERGWRDFNKDYASKKGPNRGGKEPPISSPLEEELLDLLRERSVRPSEGLRILRGKRRRA